MVDAKAVPLAAAVGITINAEGAKHAIYGCQQQ
jgi:hypothetical protein